MERIGAKIAVIGGGTGSFTLLQNLKYYTKHISALVNMADDGGSTGVLRDELGALPPGDVRQCLVELSESEKVRELFTFRFEEGSMKGHAFGNLFITALEKMTGNFAEAVETAGDVLNIIGEVHPITLDPVKLVLTTGAGEVIKGEFQIAHADFSRKDHERPELSLEPKSTVNPAAKQAILDADIVVIAPGNLYGSIAPALIVPGVSEVLNQTKAKKVYVCNLVTKPGQTDGFKVHDFADEIERLGQFKLDYVLFNNEPPSQELLDKYARDGEYAVDWDSDILKQRHYHFRGRRFISGEMSSTNRLEADPIAAVRSFIRHDSDAVARQLMRIYFT